MTNQRQHSDYIETKKQEASTQQKRTGGSSSTTTYHTEPGVSVPMQDLEVIRQTYEELLGTLNFVKAGIIERAYQNGLQTSAILDALTETALAPRPSHYYFAAILRRYMEEGIRTGEEAEAQRARRRFDRERRSYERWSNWYNGPENELPI